MRRLCAAVFAGVAVWTGVAGPAQTAEAAFELRTSPVAWEQLSRTPAFTALVEREEYCDLDRVGRMVFAVQVGSNGPRLDELSVAWQVRGDEAVIARNTVPIAQGAVDVGFSLGGLKPGRYDVAAELRQGDKAIGQAKAFFRLVTAKPPPQAGRIALNLPVGLPLKEGSYPVSCGVPFPKGALWDAAKVRLVAADGRVVPIQTIVRSRWGHTDQTSIRWLGLDFQAERAPAWWPERKDTRYFVEFGPTTTAAPSPRKVQVTERPEGLEVDTGALQFLVRRSGFNLLDRVRLNGRMVMQSGPRDGLYLVAHEGSVYRAANDRDTTLTVEERGDLRVALRAEGWYVKDGTDGKTVDWKLPTDRLCKFITRIEAYEGKPYVRILNTWVLTFDSNSVRMRDVGLSLPVPEVAQAAFGVESEKEIVQAVPADGVRLVQHLPHEFAVEDGAGQKRAGGRHSAGWLLARAKEGIIGVSHRETWQRFPKELEVLPNALKLHIWPAHGRAHPEIDELAPNQIHRLWYAHQGAELNMAQPWKYFIAAIKITGNPAGDIYDPAGTAKAGVYASAMGVAVTSDLLVHFAPAAGEPEVRDVAACFQTAPHALPDPAWTCDGTLALGYVHAYDPEHMKTMEEAIEDYFKGAVETLDESQDYGMWIYRSWHDGAYLGEGRWPLYRLYNTTHHYDSYMPWLFYARSGDPFYLQAGRANIRQLSDVQMIHYDQPDYPQRELHTGQGRLVGAMRHTNGFNTWGGDHAVLYHSTCYNSLITAYYLTGDLRLREVLVDEWQKTITCDRRNPQFGLAAAALRTYTDDMVIPFRDNTNALGEVIDLYQLTYHPALLALMAPMLDNLANRCSKPWGQGLHNVLQFYGSEAVRTHLLDAVKAKKSDPSIVRSQADYVPKNRVTEDPFAFFMSDFPAENYALAAILDPKADYAGDALIAANPGAERAVAARVRGKVPRALGFCMLPDQVIYLTRVMYALAQTDWGLQIADTHPLPTAPGHLPRETEGWVKIVVRKDRDQAFTIHYRGMTRVGSAIKVFGPDNQLVRNMGIPRGRYGNLSINIPKDGQTGQYVIFVQAQDVQDEVCMPLTTLPEVFVNTTFWGQYAPTRFFTRSRGDAPEPVEISPHGPGRILDRKGHVLSATDKSGTPAKAMMGPEGVWLVNDARYLNRAVPSPLVIAVEPQRWFMPDNDKLKLTPSGPAAAR